MATCHIITLEIYADGLAGDVPIGDELQDLGLAAAEGAQQWLTEHGYTTGPKPLRVRAAGNLAPQRRPRPAEEDARSRPDMRMMARDMAADRDHRARKRQKET